MHGFQTVSTITPPNTNRGLMKFWLSEAWVARKGHVLTIWIVGSNVLYEWEEAEMLEEWNETCNSPTSTILIVSVTIDTLTSSNLNIQSYISTDMEIIIGTCLWGHSYIGIQRGFQTQHVQDVICHLFYQNNYYNPQISISSNDSNNCLLSQATDQSSFSPPAHHI